MSMFGWGLPSQTLQEKIDAERREREALELLVPDRMCHHDNRAVANDQLLAEVKQIQQANGIDDGFCFLYLIEAIWGFQFEWLPQLIGSCVASGDMRTTAYRMAAEVFLLNQPESIFGETIVGPMNLAPFAPYNYRMGRDAAGINGSSDGSLCLPHIKGKMKYGHLPCSTPGLVSDAFPEPQDMPLYRRWGAGNTLASQYHSVASQYVLEESENVKTVDTGITLINQFKPQNNCSGFAFKKRGPIPGWKLADGSQVDLWTIDPANSWQHNMSIIGYVTVKGTMYEIWENSWGKYHSNRRWFPISMDDAARVVARSERQSVGEMNLTNTGPAWPEE